MIRDEKQMINVSRLRDAPGQGPYIQTTIQIQEMSKNVNL